MTSDRPTYERLLASFPRPRHAELSSGVRLAYREWGNPGAPPVVLIHGITSNSLSWARVAERLAEDGRYRVIATDNRGHGDSSAPERGYRFEDQAEDTAQLLAALGIERARMMGHSWGGAIALTLASGRHGGMIERLVLEDPLVALTAERTASVGEGYVAQVGLSQEGALAKLPSVIRPGWTEADAAGKLEAMMKGHKHAVRAVFGENPGRDLVPHYPRLPCPTLMVLASPERGGIVPEARLKELQRIAPAVRIETVTGADHNVHRTRFEEFMSVAEPFLKGA